MTLLNYTTQIEATKTIAEIQQMLAAAGALAVMMEFDADGAVEAVSFKIRGPLGHLSYQLPCNVVPVLRILDTQARAGKVPRRFVSKDQALRVGWRIVKDWVEAQLALVQTQMVTIDQVFLPYARTNNGQTVYQRYIEHGMAHLLEATPDPTPRIV